MRSSRRANASLSLLYFSSKSHLSDYLLWFAWLEQIVPDSFSCLGLQESIDAGLREQHIRLIADVWFLLGCRRHRRDADRNVCIHRFCV